LTLFDRVKSPRRSYSRNQSLPQVARKHKLGLKVQGLKIYPAATLAQLVEFLAGLEPIGAYLSESPYFDIINFCIQVH